MVKLISPDGNVRGRHAEISKRLDALDGRRIAFFDNRKPGANIFLRTVATEWSRRGAEVRFFEKMFPTGPADRSVLVAVGEWAEAAVFAFAD
jgi:hypothetical protein